ncbi:hypothetical protein AB4Z13_14480 [Rhizobium sp. YAF28]
MSGQIGGDYWRNFIYDFQTLIAGVAAIVAAYATVRQMQATDVAAQDRHDQLLASARENERENRERHNQLVEMSVRKDRLIVERLIVPHLFELVRAKDKLRTCIIEIPQINDVSDPALQDTKSRARTAVTFGSKAFELKSRQAWIEAAPLLDGLTTFHAEGMQRYSSMLVETAKAVESYIVNPLVDDGKLGIAPIAYSSQMTGKTVEVLQDWASAYNSALTHSLREIDDVICGLERLRSEYGLGGNAHLAKPSPDQS